MFSIDTRNVDIDLPKYKNILSISTHVLYHHLCHFPISLRYLYLCSYKYVDSKTIEELENLSFLEIEGAIFKVLHLQALEKLRTLRLLCCTFDDLTIPQKLFELQLHSNTMPDIEIPENIVVLTLVSQKSSNGLELDSNKYKNLRELSQVSTPIKLSGNISLLRYITNSTKNISNFQQFSHHVEV